MCHYSAEHTDTCVGIKRSFCLYQLSGRFIAVELLVDQSTEEGIEVEFAYVVSHSPASSS